MNQDPKKGKLMEVAAVFFKLGCIGFGELPEVAPFIFGIKPAVPAIIAGALMGLILQAG